MTRRYDGPATAAALGRARQSLHRPEFHATPAAILLEAFRAMAINRLRTALTMLGMIIGVGAVVVMMGVGQGAQSRYRCRGSFSMGSNLLIAMPGATAASGVRVVAGAGALR